MATVSFAIAWQVGCGSQAQHEPSDAELINDFLRRHPERARRITATPPADAARTGDGNYLVEHKQSDYLNDSRWPVPFEREWPYNTSPKRQACDSDGTDCDGGDDSVKNIYILVQQLLDANTPAHLTSSVTSMDPILALWQVSTNPHAANATWTDIGNTANLFWTRPHRSPSPAAERWPGSGWW